MRPRTDRSYLLLITVLLLGTWLAAQSSSSQSGGSTQNPPAQPPAGAVPPEAGRQEPSSAPPAPNQPGETAQAPQGESPETNKSGVYVFKKEVDEVTLHATVVDDHNNLITGLTRNDFTVFEDGKPQRITSFRHEDIPVAMGIVIDNSGSMRDKRPAVNAAAINLVQSSNPQDKVFIVNFNEEYFLDQDFTNSIPKLKDALERIEARGGTALYDAVVASADHLSESGILEKEVLLVVTDGEDNASREVLEQAVRRLQEQNGPTVYTIGLLEGEHAKRARRALRAMAEDTGGVAFFPGNLGEVSAITSQIAHDIRNQYTIGYKPSTPRSVGGYRTVKVEARARGYKKLQVRTRSGYYAGPERASANGPS
jgi:Ca-activated chloride channel homolog